MGGGGLDGPGGEKENFTARGGGKKSEASPWLVFYFQLWARSSPERLSYSRRHVENGPFRWEGKRGAIHAKSIPSSRHKIPQYLCLRSCALRLNYTPSEKEKKILLAPPPPPHCIRRHPSIWLKHSHHVPGSPRCPHPTPPWLPRTLGRQREVKGT